MEESAIGLLLKGTGIAFEQKPKSFVYPLKRKTKQKKESVVKYNQKKKNSNKKNPGNVHLHVI